MVILYCLINFVIGNLVRVEYFHRPKKFPPSGSRMLGRINIPDCILLSRMKCWDVYCLIRWKRLKPLSVTKQTPLIKLKHFKNEVPRLNINWISNSKNGCTRQCFKSKLGVSMNHLLKRRYLCFFIPSWVERGNLQLILCCSSSSLWSIFIYKYEQIDMHVKMR